MKFCCTLVLLLGLAMSWAGNVFLQLPEKIYAVPGVESNVYFDNIVLTPNSGNFIFDVDCAKGRNDEKRWRFTPGDGDVGEFDWKIRVSDGFKTVAEGTARLVVVPKNAGAGKEISILVVGDSLTAASVYPARIFTLSQGEGNPRLTMIGSNKRTPEGVRHEGFGGWTWKCFLTRVQDPPDPEKPRLITSRFLVKKDGKYVPDFQQYLNEYNGGKAPDYITVMLGINDVFGAVDENLDERIKDILENADRLIAFFRTAAPDAIIGIGFPTPGAASQDAFGSNYRCGQTRWQFRKNQHRLCAAMMEKFGKAKDPKISLIPTYVNLDCANNFPVRVEDVNAGNEQKITRQNNGVHPAPAGYNQIGDTFYCWLKNQLNSGK